MDSSACSTWARGSTAWARENQDPQGWLMPAWKPVKRRELIAVLRKLGFSGPYSGGKHDFMQKADLILTIPCLLAPRVSLRTVGASDDPPPPQRRPTPRTLRGCLV